MLSAYQWPNEEVAQLLDALPRGHSLILFQGLVPRLGSAHEVVQGEPHGVLAMEELLAPVELIERALLVIIGGELKLVEALGPISTPKGKGGPKEVTTHWGVSTASGETRIGGWEPVGWW